MTTETIKKLNLMETFENEMIRKNVITYSNAVVYRNYRIYHNDSNYPGLRSKFCFVHEDYDGAPDAHDNRNGFAASIDQAIILINQQMLEL